MPDGFRSLDLKALDAGTRYRLLTGLIVPRPIGFVSTLSADGTPNLAPFSFFMVGGTSPPSLMFSPLLDIEGEPKDSLKNVCETKEFVVHLVTREMAVGVNEASFAYPQGSAEWDASGFTMLESQVVKPPRVAESPVQFEYRLFQAVRHGEGSSAAVYVVGEIVMAHIDVALLGEDNRLLLRFEPISRLGGSDYLDLATGKLFELDRPKGPASSSLD